MNFDGEDLDFLFYESDTKLTADEAWERLTATCKRIQATLRSIYGEAMESLYEHAEVQQMMAIAQLTIDDAGRCSDEELVYLTDIFTAIVINRGDKELVSFALDDHIKLDDLAVAFRNVKADNVAQLLKPLTMH